VKKSRDGGAVCWGGLRSRCSDLCLAYDCRTAGCIGRGLPIPVRHLIDTVLLAMLGYDAALVAIGRDWGTFALGVGTACWSHDALFPVARA